MCLPMQETKGSILCQGDPMEKEMVTHSRILAWEIPWTEKTGKLQAMGLQMRHNLGTKHN